VAKKWLASAVRHRLRACMTQLGELPIPFESWEQCRQPFAPVADVQRYEDYMDALRKAATLRRAHPCRPAGARGPGRAAV
jgi:chorismate synthase